MTRIVRVLGINFMGATTRTPRIPAFRNILSEFHPDVVVTVENNDFRLASVLGSGWLVHQGYLHGRKNSVVAIKKKPGVRKYGTRFFLGSSADNDPPIDNRWIPRMSAFHGNTEAICWQAAHAPPKRNGDKYPQFRENLIETWEPRFTVTVGDQNGLAVGNIARLHKMHYYRAAGDVMFIASSLPFKGSAHWRGGFDHPIIIGDVDLTRAEK